VRPARLMGLRRDGAALDAGVSQLPCLARRPGSPSMRF